MPDHWMPLAIIGRTRRYRMARVARLSGLAGIAHVLVSVLLGAVIIVIGLQFRSAIEHAQETIVGVVLIVTGLGFTVLELTGRGGSHRHGDHAEHDHGHDHSPEVGLRGIAAVMVPFGAAASPDLTILPVFLAATTAGAATAIGSVLVFAIVTIATIVGLTLAATFGGYQVRGQWLDRWGNTITAVTLLIIGTLVLTGTI